MSQACISRIEVGDTLLIRCGKSGFIRKAHWNNYPIGEFRVVGFKTSAVLMHRNGEEWSCDPDVLPLYAIRIIKNNQ